MDRDEGESWRIDLSICFRRGDVSYPESDDSEGGLGQIEESIYVKHTNEQIILEAAIIESKDAWMIWFGTTCLCLQQQNN